VGALAKGGLQSGVVAVPSEGTLSLGPALDPVLEGAPSLLLEGESLPSGLGAVFGEPPAALGALLELVVVGAGRDAVALAAGCSAVVLAAGPP
jgi:hypothetical protein